MMYSTIGVATFYISFLLSSCWSYHSNFQKDVSIETVVLIGNVSQTYHNHVNNTIEYVYQYKLNGSIANDVYNGDIRVHVTSAKEADPDYPVIFVVRQQKGVLSWQLPIRSKFDETKTYNIASRTLCSDTSDKSNDLEKIIFVSVSTASVVNVEFTILVSIERNFIIGVDEEHDVEVSPPSPRFYQFIFPRTHSKFMLLEVKSNDSSCMTVSLQNASCPVLDQENNVQFEGYWQTMSLQSGMTIRKEDFPVGFYVVFVMHSDDSRCVRTDSDQYQKSGGVIRSKRLTFVIHEKITDLEYLTAIFGTIGIFLIFYVFSFVISCAYMCRNAPLEFPIENEDPCPAITGHRRTNGTHEVENPVSTSGGISESRPLYRGESINGNNNPVDSIDDVANATLPTWFGDSDSSLDETDIDMLEDANRDKDVFRYFLIAFIFYPNINSRYENLFGLSKTTTSLCVAALARKNPRVLAKKSQLYLWTLLTVATFYGLPVVQLVFTYQKVLHTTGNQDLCYYNYLCSHPLGVLLDFNHVYSNIGYIMLGILFIMLVFRRERLYLQMSARFNHMDVNFGIPRHYGLFYAMGVALVMEGILSACYHVCPNHSNFQFDTCFMYVNAILCMLKIYQTRRPDINASAYMAFSCLAFIVLIGVVGVLAGNIYFWVAFTVLHVGTCLFLSVQIYYLGRWRLDCGILKRIYLTWKNDCLASPLQCLRPSYVDRIILLIIANSANWTIAGYGVYTRSHDFASHLLLIFMSNLLLYTLFYIVMKLTHRERILFQPFVYITLSVAFWGLSLYVFLQRSTSWQLTPAESRTYNRECLLLRFYDTHDIWHFLSAASMFFSFMILLTLDDDLVSTPRTKIHVF